MKKLKFSLPFPIHSILFALFPILFLYSHNITEVRLNVLLLPITVTLGSVAILYLVLFFIFRSVQKSAVILSLIVVIFFSHGDLSDILKKIPPFANGELLAVIWVVLVSATTIFLFKTKKTLEGVNNILNVFSLLLVILPLVTIIPYEVTRKNLVLNTKVTDVDKSSKTENKPDIYYFIFEEYTSSKSLKTYDNFDNSSIENFLKSKGFFVAADSKSNYPKTFLSLASSLNYEYLDFLTSQTGGGMSGDETIVNPLIEDNKAVKFLKGEGYKYYHLGSWWDPTATNHNADINFVSPNVYLSLDDFSLHLLDTTLAATIIKDFYPKEFVSTDGYINHRDRTLYEVDRLKSDVPKLPGPKFVFAHLLTPHEPFVFGDKCQSVDQNIISAQEKTKGFIDQVKCTNTLMENIVNSVIKNSKNPPVIVIQADEGELPLNNVPEDGENWGSASTETLKEKFGIFNAYYLPESPKILPYSTITPVNTFRLIFNDYFGENLPLLPDKEFIFPTLNNLYKFDDVSSKLK